MLFKVPLLLPPLPSTLTPTPLPTPPLTGPLIPPAMPLACTKKLPGREGLVVYGFFSDAELSQEGRKNEVSPPPVDEAPDIYLLIRCDEPTLSSECVRPRPRVFNDVE
jgi:hypothetical protein